MKRLSIILPLLIAACSQAPDQMTLGTQVFAANCASCHGADMKGAPGKHAANLTDDYWLHAGADLDGFIMTAADVEQTVTFGIRSKHPKTRAAVDMPARGMSTEMDAGEINDVVDYVWSWNGGKIDAATKARGIEMFEGEGGCYDCHATDALGNSAVGGPNLKRPDTWIWGHDRAALHASVTNGHAGNSCPAFVGKLKPAEIKAVAAYVVSKAAALKF